MSVKFNKTARPEKNIELPLLIETSTGNLFVACQDQIDNKFRLVGLTGSYKGKILSKSQYNYYNLLDLIKHSKVIGSKIYVEFEIEADEIDTI